MLTPEERALLNDVQDLRERIPMPLFIVSDVPLFGEELDIALIESSRFRLVENPWYPRIESRVTKAHT